jgi:UDP-glucose 4-epimerase
LALRTFQDGIGGCCICRCGSTLFFEGWIAMSILVTGGAGYIGSHMIRLLLDAKESVVGFDNMSKGHREAVAGITLIEGDLHDAPLLKLVLREHDIGEVIHFAGSIIVPESMENPEKYYLSNVVGSLNLLRVMREEGVGKIVFSSSAAVYGEPENIPLTEDAKTQPVNVYGRSKLMIEHVLADYSAAYGLQYTALRYFNVAGAHPDGGIGEDHDPETHIIPLIIKTLLGQREGFTLFGTDYPTEDGTCIRDYIHVVDLCDAHLLALKWMRENQGSRVYNLGNGNGFSNRRIIETAEQIAGRSLKVAEGPRRAGDPAVLIAGSERISRELGWKPRYPSLETIIESAWRWHSSHPHGYAGTDTAQEG